MVELAAVGEGGVRVLEEAERQITGIYNRRRRNRAMEAHDTSRVVYF